ncbi:MAG: helix-turn-helix domain-containing protein [Bdellovibrionales bacterium]
MDFIGTNFQSEGLRRVQNEIKSVQNSPFPVSVVGSRGSGKTSWALALAKLRGPFHIVEPDQAPRTVKDWKSLFIDFSAKTLLFEDVEKWSAATQNALSAYLREGARFGKGIISTASSQILVRVQEGLFRHDLYHRLNVRSIQLPRLSECQDDIESTAQFWVQVHSLVAGRSAPIINPDSLEKLKSVEWTGDWTEFVSILERALTFCSEQILPEHLVLQPSEFGLSKVEAGLTLAEMEKKLILQTLRLTASNKSQAARLLGISIRTLRNKLNEYKQEGFHELV